MFKLVVLCAFIAAAGAEPGAVLSPFSYSAAILAPATTTITKQASSVVHPSPVFYSAPQYFTHFIKKRSAGLAYPGYIAPTTYISAAPLTTTYSAPLVHASSILPAAPLAPIYTATHLIKKRSAAFAFPSTYIAPTSYISTAPLATTYSAPLIHTAPIVPTAPLAHIYTAPHLIKKRSAAFTFPSTYIAPTSYISTAPLTTTYSAPLVHSAPFIPAAPLSPFFSTAHLIKKRSAPLTFPTTYIAPTTYAATPFIGSAYTATAPIYSTPLISSPFSFPHFIKK